MFQRFAHRPDNIEYLHRIEGWTRARFAIAADQIVLVSEERGTLPGFPDRDTTIRFWTDPATRYRLRIFKPARDVCADDLPLAWLLPALIDDGEPDCC